MYIAVSVKKKGNSRSPTNRDSRCRVMMHGSNVQLRDSSLNQKRKRGTAEVQPLQYSCCNTSDDLMLAGDESALLSLSAPEKVRDLYDWGRWETDTFEMRGCRVQHKRDGSIAVDQTQYARASQNLRITALDDVTKRCSTT